MKYLFLFIIFLISPKIYAQKCSSLLSSKINEEVIIHPRLLNDHFKLEDAFGEKALNDLFIGFSGHTTYLSHRGMRLVIGSVFDFQRARVLLSTQLDRGLLIRVTGISEKHSLEILNMFEEAEGKFFITCSTGVCSVLQSSGVLPFKPLLSILPQAAETSITKKLLAQETTFQKYIVGYKSLKDFKSKAILHDIGNTTGNIFFILTPFASLYFIASFFI